MLFLKGRAEKAPPRALGMEAIRKRGIFLFGEGGDGKGPKTCEEMVRQDLRGEKTVPQKKQARGWRN